MVKKIISLVVAGLFLFNSIAFGMAPEHRLAPIQNEEGPVARRGNELTYNLENKRVLEIR